MKKIIWFSALFIVTGSCLSAQTPQAFRYQAVVRNSSGNLILNQVVGFRISILQGGPSGTLVYQELHTPTTNNYGLVNLEIGRGTVLSGTFSSIDWAAGNIFMKVELDPAGGSAYIEMGTSELLSVPFSLYSSATGDTSAWRKNGDNLFYNAGNIGIGTNNPWARLQVSGGDAVVNSLTVGRGGGSVSTNTTLGYQALQVNTSGNYNTAVGYRSQNNNEAGYGNTACGNWTLFSNISGYHNTVVGSDALYLNTSGYRNTAVGYRSLYSNTTGIHNVALGYRSMYSNSTGKYNAATGYQALNGNTVGNGNTATGYQAQTLNTQGSFNTAVGYQSLNCDTSGFSNVAVGARALFNCTNRSNTVAIGDSALYSNGLYAADSMDATGNTAVGSKALFSNTTGYRNTAYGDHALTSNTTGEHNTANGSRALHSNTWGYDNTANGSSALYYNSTGGYNTACGRLAMYHNLNGMNNTACGSYALYENTNGWENTACGFSALYSNKSGGNTAIGASSGESQAHISNGTFLGKGADASVDNLYNVTAIGYYASTNADDQVRIGNSQVTSIGGYTNWTNISDGQYKSNIQENVAGLDFILNLRPITYQLDINMLPSSLLNEQEGKANLRIDQHIIPDAGIQSLNERPAIVYSGFDAREVEEAAKSAGYNFSGVDKSGVENGGPYGLRYADFVVPLVKALQEQQVMIEKLQQEIQGLKTAK
jgi:hypothetical protein